MLRRPMSFELHAHLYGCLTLRDLVCMAGRENLRYDFFNQSYESTYGQRMDLEQILAEKDWLKLARSYYFLRSGNFRSFQTGFDLVIALSRSDAAEFQEIVRKVQDRQTASFAEYRQLFSPLLDRHSWSSKVTALAGALDESSRSHPEKQMRLVMSLLRDDRSALWQYETLKELQKSNESVQRMLVAVDFCATEEGFPPGDKAELFARILQDNRQNPAHALALLYHVGESFTDKSVESAARWVYESACLGVHRLGHALALGIAPEHFQGTVRQETARERLAQIDFECHHQESLQEMGYEVNIRALHAEKELLSNGEPVRIVYDETRVEKLKIFQDFCMKGVRDSGAVIECCPSSNLRIGSLSIAAHPLRRFLYAGLSVVIGSDDPGILRTDLNREFRLLQKFGLTAAQIQGLEECARRSTSEILSGRAVL
ncbi:MAG: hypothetical protein HS115_09495 [Spirochaetales bacterium]|nr:hypothetical protein [Spirochaetales bacterium]